MPGRCTSLEFGAAEWESPMTCCHAKHSDVARRTRRAGRSALRGRFLHWEKGRICAAVSPRSRSRLKISFANACFERRQPVDARPDEPVPAAEERQQRLGMGLVFGAPGRIQTLLLSRNESKGFEVFFAPAESPEPSGILEAMKVPLLAIYPATFSSQGERKIQRRIICVP